jgi:WhiB family redox-sensing transcriptional regulator
MQVVGFVGTAKQEGVIELLTGAADWKQDAMCKGRTSLFFAPKAERPEARQRREEKANRLCVRCPVQVQCKEFARQHREYGFWGGENEEDRHLAGFTVSAPIGIRARAS